MHACFAFAAHCCTVSRCIASHGMHGAVSSHCAAAPKEYHCRGAGERSCRYMRQHRMGAAAIMGARQHFHVPSPPAQPSEQLGLYIYVTMIIPCLSVVTHTGALRTLFSGVPCPGSNQLVCTGTVPLRSFDVFEAGLQAYPQSRGRGRIVEIKSKQAHAMCGQKPEQ